MFIWFSQLHVCNWFKRTHTEKLCSVKHLPMTCSHGINHIQLVQNVDDKYWSLHRLTRISFSSSSWAKHLTCVLGKGYWTHGHLRSLLWRHIGAMASQITSLTTVHSTGHSGADQRKPQSSASLAFVWGIHRSPVNSPNKWPLTRKMLPFNFVIMDESINHQCQMCIRFCNRFTWELISKIV